MTFVKGQPAWNKGIKVWWRTTTPFKKGVHYSQKTEFGKGMVPWNKGTKGVMKAWNKGLKGKLTGKNHPQWKGGITHDSAGYILQRVSPNRQMLQHRFVMEQYLGRKLRSNEYVHHKNGIKSDNRLENLALMTSNSHAHLHYSLEVYKYKKGHQNNFDKHKIDCECIHCIHN